MAYNESLAMRVRNYLNQLNDDFIVEEKKMFGGLAFMVNDKMCINVGDDQLMCRFDPSRLKELSERKGFILMIMNNKEYKGYCYVDPDGYSNNQDFEFWMKECLEYNHIAKSSKKKSKSR